MSFLCLNVGLLKLRRFTRTGLANSRTRGLRSNIRNRGTSIAFERSGSDVSLASQGGFSALYGEVNPVGRNEKGRQKPTTSEDSAANADEYFAGIYIGGDAGKSSEAVAVESSCQKTPKAEILSQDPATVQSFTFFEETFTSSQQLQVEMKEDETQDDGAPNGQQTPLLSNSSVVKLPSPSSSSKRAHYNLPNWVRQRRCLPTLNEVDFDMIDAISLGSLSISSEIDTADKNNNNLAAGRGPEKVGTESKTKGSKVIVAKPSSAKRTHSDDAYEDASQTQNPPRQNLQFLARENIPQFGRAKSVYSPKKTKRSEYVTMDDSVFEKEPLLQQNNHSNPSVKLRPSKTVGIKKSPSMESFRRRSKKRESFLRAKPLNNSSYSRSKFLAKSNQKEPHMGPEPKDSENIRIGNLVRTKPLYMRATSERALDPNAIMVRLESSTARKWRETGDRSPLGEVTNVSQPQASICLRMEIVQRPVKRSDDHPEKGTLTPKKARDPQLFPVRLPAGKIRPTPQRTKSAHSRDSSRRRGSLRRRSTLSTEVKMDPSRLVNPTVKEENIDNIFRNTKEMYQVSHPEINRRDLSQFTGCEYSANHTTGNITAAPMVLFNSDYNFVNERTTVSNNLSRNAQCTEAKRRGDGAENPIEVNRDSGRDIDRWELGKWATPVAESVQEINAPVEPNPSRKQESPTAHQVTNTEAGPADSQQLPPKQLVRKPKFADNSVKEARIVSTSKTAVDSTPEEGDTAPLLPPKMAKSASFTGPSHSAAAKDSAASSKSTTRSATNVRALQIPLAQQQRRKLRRGDPVNRNRRAHRVSAVEASREDIVEVVAAMKASLESTKSKKGKSAGGRRAAIFGKDAHGDAVAVYDFEARNEDDVSVKIGDVVTVMNKDDPDWLFVRKRSGGQQEGFVPRIFLRLKLSDEESEKSDTASEVQTKRSDLTHSVANVVDEQQHTSPLDTILEQTSFQTPNSNRLASTCQTNHAPSAQTSAPATSEGAATLRTIDQSLPSRAETHELRHHSSSQSQLAKPRDESYARGRDRVRGRKFNTNGRGTVSAVLIETYVVVSDYTPQDEDEVSLVEGEVVVVNSGQQHEMDWMWVYVPRTEKFGFVPAFSARPLGFHFSDV